MNTGAQTHKSEPPSPANQAGFLGDCKPVQLQGKTFILKKPFPSLLTKTCNFAEKRVNNGNIDAGRLFRFKNNPLKPANRLA
ncbi:hypothetical protein TPE_2482 [Treponema pedis str. T A4]|uniref:Uncharacterized protein n=1 Tax=Treponema pedis str. T A4 TaxID=1291379 RepID=S6A949_9SPIR|nr:hypothetical protein TPE_2482 [Treponema pedis str. T A4]